MLKRWFLGGLSASLLALALGCSGQQAKTTSASGPQTASADIADSAPPRDTCKRE